MTRNVFDGMASGCAVIASNTAALAELVGASQTGTTFETGDDDKLAEMIVDQFAHKDRIIDSIQNVISFVRNNNRDSHVQNRLEFLTRTLNLGLMS